MASQFINAPSPSRREARNFEQELDIVIVGNTASVNVTSGQYVTVRDSTITGITDGIYKATANVAAGTAFVAANLSAVTSGALNDLSGNLATVSNNLTTVSNKVNSLILREYTPLLFSNSQVTISAKSGYKLMAITTARDDLDYNVYIISEKNNGTYLVKDIASGLNSWVNTYCYWLKV